MTNMASQVKVHSISKASKADWYTNPEIKTLLARTEVGKVKLSVPVYMAHGDADIDTDRRDASNGNRHEAIGNQRRNQVYDGSES